MRIVAISDTHTKHDDLGTLPDGDVLIHAGDWTFCGRPGEIRSFLDWFEFQPHKHKIFICGNHELTLDREHLEFVPALRELFDRRMLSMQAHYLENSGVEIEGIKFRGSPQTPEYKGWGFGVTRDDASVLHWAKIPKDTNVLITHGPPYGTLDTVPHHKNASGHPYLGCDALNNRVWEIPSLKAHVFGHIHDSAGYQDVYGVRFVNASSCDEGYRVTNKPQVFDL